MATLEIPGIDVLSFFKARVHPSVLLSIVEHFSRRTESENVIVGALLGSFQDNVYDVKSCIPLRQKPGEKPPVDHEYFQNTLSLHQRAAKQEQVIGWYTTAPEITDALVSTHEYFMLRSPAVRSLLLTVNVDLAATSSFSPRAYVARALSIATESGAAPAATSHGATVGYEFVPLRTSVLNTGAERACLASLSEHDGQRLSTRADDAAASGFGDLGQTIQDLLRVIAQVDDYVQDVISGRKPADAKIGRELLRAVSSVEALAPAELDKVLSSRVQDMLMLQYLADIAKAQTLLAERLQMLCS